MTAMALALPFDFERPAWLLLVLLVPVLWSVSLRRLAGLDRGRRVAALALRSALIVLIACCLARVHHVRRDARMTTIFLVDRSRSVEGLADFQEDYLRRAAESLPPDDRLGVVAFAGHAYLEQKPMEGGYFVPPGRRPEIADAERTNIAEALRLAMALFPHDTTKRIVLLSDGNDNMGDVLDEARRAKANGIPVDVVPLHYERKNEIAFDRLVVPTYAEPGEMVPIRMRFDARRAATGRIVVYHNGRPIPWPEEQARVTLRPGVNTYVFKTRIASPGTHIFEAEFIPDDPTEDATPQNNRATAFTFVSGARTALLVTTHRDYDAPLVEALRRENVAVAVKTVEELGTFDLPEMMQYAAILLSNVPASAFTEAQQQALAAYVREMGSGLIMLGGDESFGAGGWIGTPVEDVMPVTFEIKHKRVIPEGALVLIMHSCEVPRGNFWAKAMAKKSVDTISSRDWIGVLAYSYSPMGENWEVPLQKAGNKRAVKAHIDRMRIGDMPDFGPTMRMALKELTTGRGATAAQKHVIIFSDGDAQPPPSALLAAYRRAGITVSTVAIGWGGHVMQGPMRSVAKQTGGRFYPARNPKQLPQIFMKESKVIRRALVVEDPFRPRVLHAQSELLAGIRPRERLPTLGGMVLTSPRQDPTVVIPLIRATDDGDDPVLAHWQCGLGKAVAFTSGYWPAWGRQWTGWSKFARFWAQIVRWAMRQEAPANFETYTRVDGTRGRIVIDALDKDARYLDLLQLESMAVGPGGKRLPLRFTQTGPGHYEAEFDLEDAGAYLAAVRIRAPDGRPLGVLRTGLSVPYSPEYRDLATNEALLRDVAEQTGGRWLDMPPEQADVFAHTLPPVESRRPAWPWLLAWWVLPLFLLDVAVRRLASAAALSVAVELVVLVILLFAFELIAGSWWQIALAILIAEVVGWTVRRHTIVPLFERFTHTAVVLSRVGERSGGALGRLRGARERVREELTAGREEPIESGVPSSPPDREIAARRFDAGEDAAEAGDEDDLRQTAAPPSEDKRPAMTPQGDQTGREEPSTMDRLLRAKRRRRERKDDPPDKKGDG
ncbi:MAG: VWA domain-containing protein [Planctomycetota bacterium]|nr:MAG: VWA domain-containing protein [Planctomycetota bacterium]